MEKTITIYLLNTAKIKASEEKILSFLPKNRIEKANRYIKKEDYYLSIGGSYLIEKYVGKGNYFYTKEGKPYKKKKHFSLSHSNEFVGLALDKFELGLDIEKIRDFNKMLIPYISSKKEETEIQKKEDFFLTWCLKESLLKCIGIGLKAKLNSIPSKLGIYQFNGDVYSSKATIYNDYQIALTIKENKEISLKIVELQNIV